MRLFFVLLLAISSLVANDFNKWIDGFKKEALKEGISQSTLDRAFDGAKLIESIIKLDRNQPHKKFTFREYRGKVVSKVRVKKGQELYKKHKALLDRVSAKYRVNKEHIIALWGIETFYGKYTGGYNIIDSLSTLAYDGRREKFFKKELINALKMMQKQKLSREIFKGSWAGAMGQCQFMPSSYLSYAVDFNNDGKADIWNDKEDIFASIANYLSKNGYKYDEPISVRVKFTKVMEHSLFENKTKKSVKEWKNLGVQLVTWAPANLKSYIIYADSTRDDAFMHFDNYKTITRWNRSNFFAYSVATLGRQIKGLPR
jgi:membrane-bound lytic murein transglycosylase B